MYCETICNDMITYPFPQAAPRREGALETQQRLWSAGPLLCSVQRWEVRRGGDREREEGLLVKAVECCPTGLESPAKNL